VKRPDFVTSDGVRFIRFDKSMFGLLFAVLVAVALLSTAIHMVMRIRLMRMDTAGDRIEWLSFRSWAEVTDTYQTVFPDSFLPGFCRFVFWNVIIFAAILLCAILLKGA
jgi:hypothetical protein